MFNRLKKMFSIYFKKPSYLRLEIEYLVEENIWEMDVFCLKKFDKLSMAKLLSNLNRDLPLKLLELAQNMGIEHEFKKLISEKPVIPASEVQFKDEKGYMGKNL